MLHAAVHCHLTAEDSNTAKDIITNLYVDNVVSGCPTEACSLEYYKEARSVMSKVNFNLRSWASNSPNLRVTAQQDNVADKETVNVLNLMWDTSQDTIQLVGQSCPTLESTQPTKQEVLQDLSKTFDPLGALTPVTISAELFMQQQSLAIVNSGAIGLHTCVHEDMKVSGCSILNYRYHRGITRSGVCVKLVAILCQVSCSTVSS